MREPVFWRVMDRTDRAAAPLTRALLTPLAWLYAYIGARKIKNTQGFDPGIPVVCVGNLTVGGVGKTPLTMWLRQRLAVGPNKRAATLSRGYGGREKGPLRVDFLKHNARQVGDEPLMMAKGGESWIGADRATTAAAMAEAGVEVIIMDDGFQNPSLTKSLSILVVDATNPWGNGFVVPKGPLREPVPTGLARADLIVLMGDGPVPKALYNFGKHIIRAHLEPESTLNSGTYIAFAGIGRPEKFFDTVQAMEGVTVADTISFPDHHVYKHSDIADLKTLAESYDARLVTTEKDYARLSVSDRKFVETLPVNLEFATAEDREHLDEAIKRTLLFCHD